MSVTRREVEHIARLAALAVDEESLPLLTEQIGTILEYVSQLEAVETPAGAAADGPHVGPPQPLRADVPRKAELALPPAQIAPAFKEGLFLVPRLGGLGSDDTIEEDE